MDFAKQEKEPKTAAQDGELTTRRTRVRNKEAEENNKMKYRDYQKAMEHHIKLLNEVQNEVRERYNVVRAIDELLRQKQKQQIRIKLEDDNSDDNTNSDNSNNRSGIYQMAVSAPNATVDFTSIVTSELKRETSTTIESETTSTRDLTERRDWEELPEEQSASTTCQEQQKPKSTSTMSLSQQQLNSVALHGVALNRMALAPPTSFQGTSHESPSNNKPLITPAPYGNLAARNNTFHSRSSPLTRQFSFPAGITMGFSSADEDHHTQGFLLDKEAELSPSKGLQQQFFPESSTPSLNSLSAMSSTFSPSSESLLNSTSTDDKLMWCSSPTSSTNSTSFSSSPNASSFSPNSSSFSSSPNASSFPPNSSSFSSSSVIVGRPIIDLPDLPVELSDLTSTSTSEPTSHRFSVGGHAVANQHFNCTFN